MSKPLGLFNLISQFSIIKEKAPALMAEFLDDLIEQQKPNLDPTLGEVQICYLMVQHPKRDGKPEYMISIVALSEDDRVLRVLTQITLSEALAAILNNLPNA